MNFTGALVQQWASDMQIDWKFHVTYHPKVARMIKRYNGILKQGLRVTDATPILGGCMKCLWTVFQTINERSRVGRGNQLW